MACNAGHTGRPYRDLEVEDESKVRPLSVAFTGISQGRARQGRIDSLGLASLNLLGGYNSGLSSCLVPDPGMMQAEEYCFLRQKEVGSGLVSVHLKSNLHSESFVISENWLKSPQPRKGAPPGVKHHNIKKKITEYNVLFIHTCFSALIWYP